MALKNPMRGMVHAGVTQETHAQYADNSVLDGITVSVHWNNLQPTANGALAGSEITRINNAITWASGEGMHVKLRLFCGRFAPTGLITSVGQFLYKDPYDNTGVVNMPKWWKTAYLDAYEDLITRIAAEWDSDPTVRDITISGSMMYYAEPLIIGISAPENQAEMVGDGVGWSGNFIATPGAGYTSSLAIAAHKRCMDIHNAQLSDTRSSFAFNPMQILVGYKSSSNKASDDATISNTIDLIDYFRGTLGYNAVLENNSARESFFSYNSSGAATGFKGKYGLMYTHFKSLGGPIFIQTATRVPNNRIGDLTQTMKGILFIGANAVEPPTNFYAQWQSTSSDHTEYSPTQFAHWTALLRNQAFDNVTPPPVPDPGTDPGSGGGSGGTGGGGDTGGGGLEGEDGDGGSGTGSAPAIEWPNSIATTVWVMKLYNLDGEKLVDLDEAFNRTMHFELNGIDSCTFSVPLSWLASGAIRSLSTSVKVWRKVQDTANDINYEDEAEFPIFAGVVAGITEDSAADEMQVTVYGAFWKLQHRYHIDRHAFFADDSTLYYTTGHYVSDPSAIMWQLIKFTNNVLYYSTGDKTGIIGPTSTSDWDIHGSWADYDPPIRFTEKTPRGQNTWAKITEMIAQHGWPDLVPLYTHLDGARRLQYFNTAIVRGVRPDNATVRFDYRVGLNNLDGIKRTTICDPGSFATLVAVQGQGDTDHGKVVYPKTFDTANYLRIDELGLYMAWTKLDSAHTRTEERNYARAQLERLNGPIQAYEVALNPVFPPYFKANFDMGDVIMVSAGTLDNVNFPTSLVFSDVEQRVYQVDLAMSENNIETCTVTMADDFTDSVPS